MKEGGNFSSNYFYTHKDYLEMNSIIHLGSHFGKPIVNESKKGHCPLKQNHNITTKDIVDL